MWNTKSAVITLCTSKAVAQCIVITPVCLCVCLSVCYHNNSKLHTSILTKLGLQVKVVTLSSRLNFGRPTPPGRGFAAGPNFWLCLTSQHAVFASLLALFSLLLSWQNNRLHQLVGVIIVISAHLWIIFQSKL